MLTVSVPEILSGYRKILDTIDFSIVYQWVVDKVGTTKQGKNGVLIILLASLTHH
jgi:hypothetical protein